MPTIRPAKPKWTKSTPALYVAATALGELKAFKTRNGSWAAQLNGAPFPILFESSEQARNSAKILAHIQGHPATVDLDWVSNTLGDASAETSVGVMHVAASHGITGFYVMHDDEPAQIPLADADEAKEASAQYLTFVWYSLSEITD